MQKSEPKKISSRAAAVSIVGKWLSAGTFPDRMVEQIVDDRAFVMEVVYGIARWRRALEWIMLRLCDRQADERAVPYLMVGLYQLFFMDTVAEYAAVSETVNAVKNGRDPRLAGFVNAILRNALRKQAELRAALAAQKPAIRMSHPDVLVKRWTERFGEERTAKLCEWNNGRPSVFVRVNQTRLSVAGFAGALQQIGVKVVPFEGDEDFLVLPHGIKVEDIPGYEDGLFSIQDPSTAKAVGFLAPVRGEYVLDACAAPGGKTMIIAGQMQDKGRIVAVDVQDSRLDVVKENIKRLDFKSVRVQKGDCTDPSFVAGLVKERKFDRILLDVPCSNTGVLCRRPDARWRFATDQLAEGVGIQTALLDSTCAALRPGGVLVYSTCSLEFEEGEGLIRNWLPLHPEFVLEKSLLVFPPEARTDGAFVAKLVRKEA